MAELRLFGRSAAPGVAKGVVAVLDAARRPRRKATGTQAEEALALQRALSQALAEVEALVGKATGEAADMLGFQVAMLSDEELVRPARERVGAGESAAAAWEAAMEVEIAGYRDAGDHHFSARTADLEDIRDRVLGHLEPGAASAVIPDGSVVVAADLPISRFLAIDWAQGGAILLTQGSPTSHVAMLARARGVPMVVGLDAADAMAGREALVDAATGEVVLDPTEATQAAFAAKADREKTASAASAAFRVGPAVTKDGTRIALNLNASSADELEGLDPAICDGIGLVRTEILFHGPGVLPDEDAQYQAYRRIVAWADGRPVTIRTLDAGGDKPIQGVTVDGESIPFLGLRGIRLSLRHPALFQIQLRALARAAAHGDLRIMLPMVTVPAELEAGRKLLGEALAGLAHDSMPAGRPKLGIMIEVPAAAIAVDQFDANFFSIGSNDLTQYVTAAGRDIGTVADLADPLNPAVLRLIASVARHGRETGREVSLCGDAGGDPRVIGALLRVGLRSLSVAPASVGAAKQAITATDLRDAAP